MKTKIKSFFTDRKTVTLSMIALLLTVIVGGSVFAALTGGVQPATSQLAVKAKASDIGGAPLEQSSILLSGREQGSLSDSLLSPPPVAYASTDKVVSGNVGASNGMTVSSKAVASVGSRAGLPAEVEGNCYKVTFKTHGYTAEGENGKTQTGIKASKTLYTDREGTTSNGGRFVVKDGGVYEFYASKENTSIDYYLKSNSPYSGIESYKIYATDDPSYVISDDTTDEYKQLIEDSKSVSDCYVTLKNTPNLDVTIEVHYNDSGYEQPVEAEGNCYKVTFKTHGYTAGEDGTTQTGIHATRLLYTDREGTNSKSGKFVVTDGGEYEYYVKKEQTSLSYYLKSSSPFSGIESYKIYATDDPSYVYTDTTTDDYKNFIANSQWNNNSYISFANKIKADITIEVTYNKSFKKVYFSPTLRNQLAGEGDKNTQFFVKGNYISDNSVKVDSNLKFTFNKPAPCQDAEGRYYFPVKKDNGALTLSFTDDHKNFNNFKAYGMTDGEPNDTPLEGLITNTLPQAKWNAKYEYQLKDYDGDVYLTFDFIYVYTSYKFNINGVLTSPIRIKTDKGGYNTEVLGNKNYGYRICAGWEYTFYIGDNILDSTTFSKVELKYTDLNGEAKTETYEVKNGSCTFTMPYVKQPYQYNTIFTFYGDESKMHNLEVVPQEFCKGGIRVSNSEGINSIISNSSVDWTGYTTSYKSVEWDRLRSNTDYKLCTGMTYKVEDIYNYFPARLDFENIEIYKKDADGNVTEEKVDVTKVDDKTYTFVMPDCDIKLTAVYRDKLHLVYLQNNKKGYGSTTLAPADSTDGKSYMYSETRFNYGPSTVNSATVASTASANSYTTTSILEDGVYTLSHNITDTTARRLKSVTAYKPYNNRYEIQFRNGEILNEPYEDQSKILTKNEDGTYTVNVDYNALAESDRIIIYTEFEDIEESYTTLDFTMKANTYSGSPPTKLTLEYPVKGGPDTVFYPIDYYNAYNKGGTSTYNVRENQKATFVLNGGQNYDYSYSGTYTAYTITVKNTENDEVLAKVYYRGGKCEFLEGTAGDVLSEPTVKYDGNVEVFEYVSFDLNIKDYPLSVTVDTGLTYVPLKVNQYIVNPDGTTEAVKDDDGFKTTIKPYGTDYNQFFAKSGSKYYSGYENEYTQSIEVTSSSADWECMASKNRNGMGINADITVPDGYMLANVVPVSYDHKGNKTLGTSYSGSAYRWDGAVAGCEYRNGSYCIWSAKISTLYAGYYERFMYPSQQLEINIYYTKKSSLTVNQIIDGFVDKSSSTELAYVAVTDAAEARENIKSFVIPDNQVVNSMTYSINGKSQHTSDEGSTKNVWTNTAGVTHGAKPKFTVTPKGSRNIVKVEAYKMVNGEKQSLDISLVSGTGFPNTATVYQLDDEVAAGDDIYVDITYGAAQTLKVDVRMLDGNNNAVANTTDTTVKVTGTLLTGTGTQSDQKAFLKDGASERIESFETKTTDNVYAYANTKIAVDTNIDDSGYVIANVLAYEMDDSGKEVKSRRLNLTARQVSPDDSEINSAAVDFSHCEMSSLPIEKNTIIVVYLAKMSKMTVSVYTADDSGEYTLGNHTGDNGSYVNVSSTNSHIGNNPYPIVTAQEDGNFNTNAFTITNNPAERTASVVQGSYIKAFAQLPQGGRYVISKVVITYKDKNGELVKDPKSRFSAAYEYKDNLTGITYYRVDFGSDNAISADNSDYEVKVYISPAQTITSKVTLSSADGDEVKASNAGTVTVYGKNNKDPEVVSPLSAGNGSSYNAIETSYPFTKKVRCVPDTELKFTVTPSNSNYYIKSVSAHLGSADGDEIKLDKSQSGNAVTYTLVNSDGSAFTMPRLSPVYIDVQFGVKFEATLNIDYSYTPDYENYEAFTSDLATVEVTGSNTNDAFRNFDVLTDVNDETKSGNKFTLESGERTASYKVLATSNVRISTDYKNGKYFIPYIHSVTDADGNNISHSFVERYDNYNYLELNNLTADKVYNVHVVLLPASKIRMFQYENNKYGDLPDKVGITNHSDHQLAVITTENSHLEKPLMYYERGVYSGRLDSITANPNADYCLVAPGTNITISIKNQDVKPKPGYLTLYTESQNGKIVDSQEFYSSLDEVPADETEKNFVYESDHFKAHNEYTFRSYFDGVDLFFGTNRSYTTYVVSSNRSMDEVVDDVTANGKLDFNNLQDNEASIPLIKDTYNRIPEEISHLNQNLYLITVKNTSDEQDKMETASWGNQQGKGDNILSELKSNVREKEIGGVTNYVYYCQINKESSTPLDNTMYYYIYYKDQTVTPPTPTNPPEEPVDSQITVTQYKRNSDSGYLETTEGQTVISLANKDNKFTYNGEETDTFSVPVDAGGGVFKPSATAYSKTGNTINLTITPPEKCIVSKVEITHSGYGTSTSTPTRNGDNYEISVPLITGSVRINVYYSKPLLTISTNNTAENGRGTVLLDGEEIISKNEFMDSALVDSDSSKKLIVNPMTYEKTADDGSTVTEYYRVAYVLMGERRDSMTLIDPSCITTDPETGQAVITLDKISGDVNLHIQLESETAEKTAALVVTQHVLIDGEYQISTAGYVNTTGQLENNSNPIYFNGEACNSFTLSDEGSLTAVVVKGTTLNFDVTPPYQYNIDKVEGRFLSSGDSTSDTAGPGETLTFTKNGNNYKLNSAMPDAGVVYVDVYYSYHEISNQLTIKHQILTEKLNTGLTNAVNEIIGDGNAEFEFLQDAVAFANKAYIIGEGSGSTDGNGKFTLPQNNPALFNKDLSYGKTIKLTDNNPLRDKLSTSVSYIVTDDVTNADIDSGDNNVAEFVFRNSDKNASQDTKLTAEFTESLNVADLSLTKYLYEKDGITLSQNKNVGFEFTVELDLLGGEDYKTYNLEYQLDGETHTATGGKITLKSEQTATFVNIPVGASYRIKESDKSGYEFIGKDNPATGTIAAADSGVIFNNKEVITVKGIGAYKTLGGENYSGDEFTFNAELVKFIKADGTVIPGDELKQIYADSTVSSVEDGKISFDQFSIVESAENAGKYIFKLSETKGTDSKYVYDENSYYVLIEVSEDNVANATYYTDEACETPYGEDGTTPPTFKNALVTDIEFIKVDNDGEAMENVEFELFRNENCTDKITTDALGNIFGVNGTVATDADGKAVFANVEYSTTEDTFYYIKETKTLNGYQLLTEPIVVKIDTNGNVTLSYDGTNLDNNTIMNNLQPNLPLTGSTGVYFLFVLGAIALLGACIILVVNKRKSRNS